MLIFCKKNNDTGITKIVGVLVLKGIFSETTYIYVCVYLRTKFQVLCLTR